MEDEKVEKVDPYKDYEVIEKQGTICEHYLVESKRQDENTNLTSVECTKCPSGFMIDSTKQKLVDGKIIIQGG